MSNPRRPDGPFFPDSERPGAELNPPVRPLTLGELIRVGAERDAKGPGHLRFSSQEEAEAFRRLLVLLNRGYGTGVNLATMHNVRGDLSRITGVQGIDQLNAMTLHEIVLPLENADSGLTSADLAQRGTRAQTRGRSAELSDRQRDILQVLLQRQCFDVDHRMTTAEIADEVEGKGRGRLDSFKRPMAELKHRGLIETKVGSGGGSWLSELGQAFIKRARNF